MSVKVEEQNPKTQSIEEFVPSPPPTNLIFDDGEPLESNRHRIAINVLIESLHEAYRERDDYFAGGNMFLYFSRSQVKNKDFRGPDFFVVLDVDGTRERQGWVIWDEQGRYPDVVIELLSPSTASTDLAEKRVLYERTFRTRNYFVYDPFDPESLQGWRLGANGRYEALTPSDRGWLWCDNLGLWLGTWEGTILRETASWLRFYDPEENLVLLGEERERERADRLAQLLIDNGIELPHD
ncbi:MULTISPECIES: Uma2 family endonuclease [Spirulina sp. CCY15215]|uniref:Uma2 family endonuclease n=1 Tax=Spirulina sp. CCY15215 TaxID=2767591 RepID=UPI001950413F|nr:Uma2 family endonuclease [Spirulina major]